MPCAIVYCRTGVSIFFGLRKTVKSLFGLFAAEEAERFLKEMDIVSFGSKLSN